jgi:hypothetical protein
MFETAVESALVGGAKKHGAITPKGELLGKGWPDRIVLSYPGRIAFVELKRPKGPSRRRQTIIRGILRRLGFTVVRLNSRPEVEAWLDEWFGR